MPRLSCPRFPTATSWLRFRSVRERAWQLERGLAGSSLAGLLLCWMAASGSAGQVALASPLGGRAVWTAPAIQEPAPRPEQEPAEEAKREPAASIVPSSDELVVSAEEVSAAIAELNAATALDEPMKAGISQMLVSAQKRLESITALQNRIADFAKRTTESASDREAAVRQKEQLQQAAAVKPGDIPQLDALRQLTTQTQAELEEANRQLATLKEEPARRMARSSGIPGLISQAEAKLQEARAQLAVEAPPGENPLQTAARKLQIRAGGMESQTELEMLRRELQYYNSTAELLPLQQEVAQLWVTVKTRDLELLQQALIRRQETRLQSLARDTREQAVSITGTLREPADQNVKLAESTLLYNDQANRISRELKEISSLRADIEQQRQTAEDRFRSVGLTDALGGMMRKQRRDLEQMLRTNRPSAQAQAEIRNLQVEIFQVQDQTRSLPSDEVLAVQWLTRPAEKDDGQSTGEAPEGTPLQTGNPASNGQLQELLRGEPELNATAITNRFGPSGKDALQLAARYRSLQAEFQIAADQKFRNLVALDTEKRELVRSISEFLAWIDTRVIWIPSAPVFGTGDWSKGREAVRWLIAPENWKAAGLELVEDLSGNFSAFLPFLLAVVVLFLFRGRLKRIIHEAGEEAGKSRCFAILPTVNCLTATTLMAALWPMILMVVGWTLSHGPEPGAFVHALGRGLIGVGVFVAPLELLRHVCRENGLAERHYGWPDRTRRYLMSTLRGFYLFSLPVLLGQGILAAQSNEDWKNSLGRFFSCLLFLVVAWYLHRIFRPAGTLFQQMAAQRPVPGSYRFRGLIHLIVVGMPLFLLVLALAGYYYTAFQLGSCLELSLSLLILMVIAGGFVLRWLLVRRRALAMEEARKARLAMAVASESNAPGAEALAASAEKSLLELSTVSRQAREIAVLVLAATTVIFLYWIWRDVLPAVGILDQKTLWTVSANGKVEEVTLKHLFLAALTAAFSWLMIRNMPGLLNLAVQRFSSLDSGARYAATTVFRYVITVIGAVTALSFLRIQWGQYSWLVAAVTVGLGFGLQEIVANFVSGLILLFERPVRVGDLVTIDNTNGVVTNIQMRATTVMTWDYQELIVPNKELVTGKLLNWTLSNHTNRLVLEVGVAYSSDPDQVRDLLEKAVRSHPEVVNDPQPTVCLEEFGDNALVFRIRCFLAQIEPRLRIKHELNSLIARSLQSAGIQIPFPQRELHLAKDAWPLFPPPVRVSEARDNPEPGSGN